MTTVSLISTGCSSDDNDKNGSSSSSIVGTWSLTEYDTSYETVSILITLNPNGTGNLREIYISGQQSEPEHFRYSYSESSRRLVLIYASDDYYDEEEIEMFTVLSISSKEMIIQNEDNETFILKRVK